MIVDKELRVSREKYLASMLMGNFRFRYGWIENFGEYNHKHLFVIGERFDDPGIPVIEEIRRGQKGADLRIWYVDIELPEVSRRLYNIPYEYPLPLSPVFVAYDGNKYLYVVYNKYNIWRLDFKGMLEDQSGNWWFRLPPCLDCNFLGDTRTDEIWNCYFIEPHYLAIISKDGRMARMDTETFVWFLDKDVPPKFPVFSESGENQTVYDNNLSKLIDMELNQLANIVGAYKTDDEKSKDSWTENKYFMTVNGIDNNEVYMCNFGGIGGKVMNVYDKQWDNFYFDTRVCSNAVKYYNKAIDECMFPMFIKRRRLYTVNEMGHVFYAWLRIYGKFDVEYQTDDFYNVDKIRIYMDYNTIQHWENTEVSVFAIESGWVDIDSSNFTPQILENDWLWDSEYTRQYVKITVGPNGELGYQYSKTPPIYLDVDLSSLNEPISKVRIKYVPYPQDYNYIARINRVELITSQENLALYDTSGGSNPLEIIRLEPITPSQDYSIDFAVWVRNNSSKTVRNVVAYCKNNKWLQMTTDNTDPNSWALSNEKYPLELGDIDPGNEIKFYIRGVNIDSKPHQQDLVVVGIYPYNL